MCIKNKDILLYIDKKLTKQNLSFKQIYFKYSNLLKSTSYKFSNKFNLEFDDIFQTTTLYLLEAYNKYNIYKNIEFSFYAKFYIENNLKRYTSKQSIHNIKGFSLFQNIKNTNLVILDTLQSDNNFIDDFLDKLCVYQEISKLDINTRKILIELITTNDTQENISKKFNKTQGQISIIMKKAIHKIKHNLNSSCKYKKLYN